MRELTSFQLACDARIASLANALLASMAEKEIVHGRTETYIRRRIGAALVYVYPGSARWEIGDRCHDFEPPDFDSEEDLLNAFEQELQWVVQNGRAPDRAKGRFVVWVEKQVARLKA